MEDVADALHDAQRALRFAETATRKNLRGKNGGRISAEVLRSAPVNDFRNPLDDALLRLEQSRHAVLIAIFAVALDEGMTIGELGRNYGFSRQRAAKYAKEAHALRFGLEPVEAPTMMDAADQD